jgi:hypothetical protein
VIVEGSGWTEGEVAATLNEARLIWAQQAKVFVGDKPSLRISNDRLLVMPPNSDARDALREIPRRAGEHVSVFIKGIAGIGVSGLGTPGKVDGRAAVWIPRGASGNVLAHEWGHTFSLRDSILPSLMSGIGTPAVLLPGEAGTARDYVRRHY